MEDIKPNQGILYYVEVYEGLSSYARRQSETIKELFVPSLELCINSKHTFISKKGRSEKIIGILNISDDVWKILSEYASSQKNYDNVKEKIVKSIEEGFSL